MTDLELSEQERERAQAILDGDARALNSGDETTPTSVTESLCRQWREHVRNDGRPQSVDAHGFTRSAIRKHISGNCSHDGTGTPVRHKHGVWKPAETAADGYEVRRLGWRYECPECDHRDIAVREQWLYCRACGGRIPEVWDLREERLVGLRGVEKETG